jgi:hypothetical protein
MNRIFLAAISALLTLTACGGGGGGSDPTGGIDGRGDPDPVAVISAGEITGFGSIIVNGVEYETDGTEFEIDGETGTETELEIGDVVVVSGTINDDGTSGTATTVTFDDVVEGPVSAKNAELLQLTVLGQTVQVVDGETLFDDTPPISFASIAVDDVIEVSGFRLADGTISATRIEGKPAGGEYEVTGVVSNLSGMMFDIEGLTVDFSAAILDNFPGTGPENGQPVEAKGMMLGDNGELLATKVEYKGNVLGDAAGAYVELEGYITRFASASDFDVSGLPVDASSAIYEGGTEADLNLNLKVEVEGNINSSGVLVAEKVEIKTSTGIRVVGLVGSISPLEVFGIQINASDLTTRFDDKSELGLENMKLADINVGDYLEVRGQEQPLGQITAFTIERDDVDARRELRGFVEAGGKNEPNLTVLGVTIVTTGTTVYRDSRGASEVPMSPAEFWAAVQEGSRVDAQGTETDTTTLTATEVELQGN